MINIFNNHIKFKENYLLLKETTNTESNTFIQILKDRKNKFCKFSYNLNKLSKIKINPELLLKGLPYLNNGLSLKETENLLKLPSVSQEGFNYLNDISFPISPANAPSNAPAPLMVNAPAHLSPANAIKGTGYALKGYGQESDKINKSNSFLYRQLRSGNSQYFLMNTGSEYKAKTTLKNTPLQNLHRKEYSTLCLKSNNAPLHKLSHFNTNFPLRANLDLVRHRYKLLVSLPFFPSGFYNPSFSTLSLAQYYNEKEIVLVNERVKEIGGLRFISNNPSKPLPRTGEDKETLNERFRSLKTNNLSEKERKPLSLPHYSKKPGTRYLKNSENIEKLVIIKKFTEGGAGGASTLTEKYSTNKVNPTSIKFTSPEWVAPKFRDSHTKTATKIKKVNTAKLSSRLIKLNPSLASRNVADLSIMGKFNPVPEKDQEVISKKIENYIIESRNQSKKIEDSIQDRIFNKVKVRGDSSLLNNQRRNSGNTELPVIGLEGNNENKFNSHLNLDSYVPHSKSEKLNEQASIQLLERNGYGSNTLASLPFPPLTRLRGRDMRLSGSGGFTTERNRKKFIKSENSILYRKGEDTAKLSLNLPTLTSSSNYRKEETSRVRSRSALALSNKKNDEKSGYNLAPSPFPLRVSAYPVRGARDGRQWKGFVRDRLSKPVLPQEKEYDSKKFTKNPNLYLTRFKGSIDWEEHSKKGNRFKSNYEYQNENKFLSKKEKRLFKRAGGNPLLKNWGSSWNKKKTYFKKLSNYNLNTFDFSLLNNINEIRKIIDAKFNFDTFLSSSQSVSYSFNKSNNFVIDLNTLYKFLKYFFTSLSALISKPVFSVSPNKISIRLLYFLIPKWNILNKERKLKYILRKKLQLINEKKHKNVFNKIMTKFKIKEFLATWKESNYLVRVPNLPLSLSLQSVVRSNKFSPYDTLLPFPSPNGERARLENCAVHTIPGEGPEPLGREEGRDKANLTNNLNQTKATHLPLSLTSNASYNSIPIETYNLAKLPTTPFPLRAGDYEIKVEAERYFYNLKNGQIDKLIDLNLLQVEVAPPAPPRKDKNLQLTSTASRDKEINSISILASDELSNLNSEALRNRSPLPSGNPLLQSSGALIGGDSASFKSLQLLKNRKINTMISLNEKISQYLVLTLERLFDKEIEVDIKRIKYPYHDSNILSQILKNSSYNTTFRNMIKKLFNTAIIKNPGNMISKQDFSIIPSFLSGIHVKLAGRINTQRVIPRFTVQSFQMGSLARGKVNYVEKARITHKNKRGAFSFTVTTSHFFKNTKIQL